MEYTGACNWVQLDCGCVEIKAGHPARVFFTAWCDEHVPGPEQLGPVQYIPEDESGVEPETLTETDESGVEPEIQ